MLVSGDGYNGVAHPSIALCPHLQRRIGYGAHVRRIRPVSRPADDRSSRRCIGTTTAPERRCNADDATPTTSSCPEDRARSIAFVAVDLMQGRLAGEDPADVGRHPVR